MSPGYARGQPRRLPQVRCGFARRLGHFHHSPRIVIVVVLAGRFFAQQTGSDAQCSHFFLYSRQFLFFPTEYFQGIFHDGNSYPRMFIEVRTRPAKTTSVPQVIRMALKNRESSIKLLQ